MRIAYRVKENHAEIVRIWCREERVMIPGEIEGVKVNAVAPYAFSVHKEEEKEKVQIWESSESIGDVLRCGGNITAIHLPETLQSIGNYAFYGCTHLKVFHGTDRITRMGSGVFTGCRLSQVEIDFYDGEKSCLKEILTEIRYRVNAVFRKEQTVTKLIFPEYYADAVENTPARIVETHYYGSGGDYRECFYRKELDYGKYDRMFALSAARDEGEVTAEIALTRLMYPKKLEEKAEKAYEAYLKEHMELVTGYCLEHLEAGTQMAAADPLAVLHFCCDRAYYTEESLEKGINQASGKKQMEALSLLMDERQKRFPKKRKTFAL